MKNLKKKLAGFLVFAMVLGILAPGAVAQADGSSATSEEGIRIDYLNEGITFSLPSSAASIQYTDADATKIANEKAVWEEMKIATDGNTLDISWVKKTKDATITFKALTADGEPVTNGTINLKAQSTDKLTVELITAASGSGLGKKGNLTVADNEAIGSPDTGYIVVYSGTTVVSPGTIQFKKGASGNWTEMSDLQGLLPKLKAKGATLYFRQVNANAWPSKEVKFSYKKQANAPKVKVDLKKDTLALKTGMEYRAKGLTDWTKVPANTKSIAISEVLSGSAVTMGAVYGGTPTTVEVRTVKNGTVPSKIAKVTIKASTMAALSAASNVGITYNVDKKQYEFTNKDDTAYEFTTVASAASIQLSDKQKWTAIKVPKAGKENDAVAKLAESKMGANDIILVRKAAQKATKAKNGVPAKEELLASQYAINDPATIKSGSARTVSGVSITVDPSSASASFGAIKSATANQIEVSGSAISGNAVTLTVKLDVTNAVGAKVKADVKKVGDASVTVKTATVEAGKTVDVEIKIPDGKDKKATSGDIKVTVGTVVFTIKVNITAAQ